MRGLKTFTVIFLTMLYASTTAQVQGEAGSNYPLRGKHGIGIGVGLLSEMAVTNEISTGGVTTESSMSGLAGFIEYAYWIEDNMAFNFGVGAIGADARTSTGVSGVTTETAVVVPMLFGVKYQPFQFSASNAMRPYLTVAVGPCFGFASNVKVGLTTGTETYSETALGARLYAGLDLSITSFFLFGFGGGYYLATDFKNRIGAKKNYSSPIFSLSFGFVFGKGK
jgi:hypothetical protein